MPPAPAAATTVSTQPRSGRCRVGPWTPRQFVVGEGDHEFVTAGDQEVVGYRRAGHGRVDHVDAVHPIEDRKPFRPGRIGPVGVGLSVDVRMQRQDVAVIDRLQVGPAECAGRATTKSSPAPHNDPATVSARQTLRRVPARLGRITSSRLEIIDADEPATGLASDVPVVAPRSRWRRIRHPGPAVPNHRRGRRRCLRPSGHRAG